MRYRLRITRVQVAERSVRAKDEEHAMEKIRAELTKPYGLLGQWQTAAEQVEIVAVESQDGLNPTAPGEGPQLLSIKGASAQLGIPAGRLYELVNNGEIDHVRVGRRTYISRNALSKFIEAHTCSGNVADYRH